MRDHARLYLNGTPVRVQGDDAWLMLSEWLRRRQALTGTKVVCAEGDCGSCSVLVGRLEHDQLVYRAVTSCIVRVAQLDATHVVTVEGLLDDGQPNAFQQAMTRCHGAQCGFCTPGIVVAMQGLTENGRPLDAHATRRGLTGNLCRCTGYDAIVRAALETDPATLGSVNDRYPPAPIVADLRDAAAEPMTLRSADHTFFKPVATDQAVDFLADHHDCTLLAGGTDLGVVDNKRGTTADTILHTAGLPELAQLTTNDNDATLTVGAGVNLHRFERELAQRLPEFAGFLEWFGSPPIRHAGTLAGNLCTASPVGDTTPALLALDAEIELASPHGRRRVPLADFHTGYRTIDRKPGELVVAIHVPLLQPDQHLRLYKVSRRKDLDISTVSAAFAFRLTDGKLSDARVVFGGVGPTVTRLTDAEAALNDQAPSLDAFHAAGMAAAQSVTPMTDVRGSDAYRSTLVRNLVLKLGHEFHDGRFNGHATPPDDDTPPARATAALSRHPEGSRA